MSWTLVDVVNLNLNRHFGATFFTTMAGATYGPLLGTLCTASILWLIVYWMYRKKVYVRI